MHALAFLGFADAMGGGSVGDGHGDLRLRAGAAHVGVVLLAQHGSGFCRALLSFGGRRDGGDGRVVQDSEELV